MKVYIYVFFLVILLGSILLAQPHSFISLKEKIKSALEQSKPLPNGLKKCDVKYKTNLEENDILIVGHAYGSPSREDDGKISPYLTKFLEESKTKIKEVIFTGDVLKKPSPERWKLFKQEMEILGMTVKISPGNHDVGKGDNILRDIFDQEFNFVYPQIEPDDDRIIVLIDSGKSSGRIDVDLINLLEDYESSDKTLLIFSHHILRPDPLGVANSTKEIDLTNNNINVLRGLKSKFKRIYLISGDSGVRSSQPRLDCISYENIFFISSGIGDFPQDKILVLQGSKILKMDVR